MNMRILQTIVLESPSSRAVFGALRCCSGSLKARKGGGIWAGRFGFKLQLRVGGSLQGSLYFPVHTIGIHRGWLFEANVRLSADFRFARLRQVHMGGEVPWSALGFGSDLAGPS